MFQNARSVLATMTYAPLLVGSLIVLSASACGCIRRTPSATFQKTRAFARFNTIEKIQMDMHTFHGDEINWVVPQAEWRKLESIFEFGIQCADNKMSEAYCEISVSGGGRHEEWTVLYVSNDEFMLKVSQAECWCGISRRDLVKLVEGREPEPIMRTDR